MFNATAPASGRPTSIINYNKMAKKLYVGGLSWGTTDDTLKQAFEQAGSVTSATVLTDKFTGRSRGFGFVEMENDNEADAAIEMWNGKEIDGRAVTVNEARPLGDKPPRRSFDRGGSRPRFNGPRREEY